MAASAPLPEFVFVPGAWHLPACYDKVINLLRNDHNISSSKVILPSTLDNPKATFKDDIDAAQDVIRSVTDRGHNVIIVAHSYGGMVGNSAIKGMALPQDSTESVATGRVIGLILIASGFSIEGLSFMAPLFNKPPPAWRVNNETGYAELVVDPRQFFYDDVEEDEARHAVEQLKTQSLKALFEGGQHSYPGWQDVPCWYIGTIEDRGLPVLVQRMAVGMARSQGATVEHVELQSSHSPFLSMPDEVVSVFVDAVNILTRSKKVRQESDKILRPAFRISSPASWLKYGLPLAFGRVIGWTVAGVVTFRRLWWSR